METTSCLCAICILIVLSGCASVNKPISNVKSICLKPAEVEALGNSDWVVVGNLFGGLGSFESEDIDKAFSTYENCSSGPNSLESVDEFASAMSGWTSIEIGRFDVPGFFSVHRTVTVLIPKDTLDVEDFDVGLPGIWMGKGNLVAANWTPDHVFVVSAILCEKGKDYRKCKSQYERGLFDLGTGFEHTLDGELKRNAVQIDVVTYKKID